MEVEDYDRIVGEAKALFVARTKKYGNSWKMARLSSLTDYVLMKYNRMTKLTDDVKTNKEKLRSDLQDALNYSIFALKKLEEETKND